MTDRHPRVPLRQAIRAVTAVVAAVFLFLCGGTAFAGTPEPSDPPSASPSSTPRIVDDSHVLSRADRATLREDVGDFPPGADLMPVWIYTTTKRAKDKSAFDEYYRSMLDTAPSDVIIIAVNTRSRHIIITSGTESQLPDSGAAAARASFTESFRAHSDYGKALHAALTSVQNELEVKPTATFPATTTGSVHHGGNGGAMVLVVLLFVVIIVIALASKGTTIGGSGGSRYRGYSNRYSGVGFAAFDSGGSGWSDSDSGGSDWSDGDSGGGDSGGGDDWSSGDSGGGDSSGDF